MRKWLPLTLICLIAAGVAFLPADASAANKKAEKKEAQHVYLHIIPQNGDVAVKVLHEPPIQEVVKPVKKAAAPAPAKSDASTTNMGLLFFVFVLACFTGFELIAKVPSQLHTPLMSGSNAISGITIVGAILSAGKGSTGVTVFLGTLAVAFAMINVVGGYLVTDRMLGMFKQKGGKR